MRRDDEVFDYDHLVHDDYQFHDYHRLDHDDFQCQYGLDREYGEHGQYDLQYPLHCEHSIYSQYRQYDFQYAVHGKYGFDGQYDEQYRQYGLDGVYREHGQYDHVEYDDQYDQFEYEQYEFDHYYYDDLRTEMITVNEKDIASLDAAYWANLNRIKLQKGVWSFDDRPYLLEPMQVPALAKQGQAPRRRAFMKATQGGITELQVNESLWGLIHGHYPRGVLYLFPTTDDVREFSKARFGPLIQANPTAIGRFVQDTDTASLKRVGDSFLYLRGAMLSQHLEVDAKESAKLRSISVDKVVFDEYDLMDPDVAGKAQGRMGDSEVKEEVYISNPTLPDFGIATVFQQGDQRHWFRKCGCGGFTCAELEFPNLVGHREDGTGYIACKKCGKPTNYRDGEWVPAEREKSKYMWSYRWSQLTSKSNDPWEILQQYQDPPDGNLADIVRLRLGLPFVSAEDKLTVQQVLSCCGTNPQLNSHHGPCAMGMDVRRHKNVVIGIRSGRERFTVLRVARLETWDEALQMAQRFNVRSCVVDIRPYEDSAREFQRKAKFKTWLCEYSESTPVGTMYNDKTGIVKVNRTEVMDATHRLVGSERMLELPAVCPEVRQFALECSAVAKVQEVNKRTRTSIFRYRKLGTAPDDYRHALNYFWLAASGGKVAVVGGPGRSQREGHAFNEYARV